MPKLNLDKQDSELLNKAISFWEKESLLNDGQAEKLRQSYEVKGFDWMRLAKYSFWIALICGGASFASLSLTIPSSTGLKTFITHQILSSVLLRASRLHTSITWAGGGKNSTQKGSSAMKRSFLPAFYLRPVVSLISAKLSTMVRAIIRCCFCYPFLFTALLPGAWAPG